MSVAVALPDYLMDLAPELLELILSYLSPGELASFGQTCRRANDFIRPNNQMLWRAVFGHVFDDPRIAWRLLMPSARAKNRSRESQWDWFVELRRRYAALNAVYEASNALSLFNPEEVIVTLLDIVDTASFSDSPPRGQPKSVSKNLNVLKSLFQKAPNAEKVVHDYHRDIESMSLPLDLMTGTNRPLTRALLGRRAAVPRWASRFHIFYGMTQREEDSVRSKASARALVYDWFATGPNADYGPFDNDKSGKINWEMLEAITSLMHRIFAATRSTGLFSIPSGFSSGVPYCLPQSPHQGKDWAGITNLWLGTYAFLDYRALVHYNFANNLEYPMDLGVYEEACGDIMRLQLTIDDSEELQGDPRLQTDLPYCKDLPKLYFTGLSLNRPSILVRGCVFLLPGGREVRWRFIISYASADQWQLEGAQPGGVRSGGGIYGLWSHVDHDDHGPVGPFAYFPADTCDFGEPLDE
ncbi:hypothetical protein P154DRAFT_44589 [Amniculicola lignicola CBS 123094]|uniref:F-box domain-containing protein n=1 Tax=Amniculicola lignicola CBS 123094 TaxID=1392246 RepID=A0A6A5WS15_9PLEO|nr:hypothetical protein P154DRAFT_44589 [Amniculicola lignicola CBS 123094]